jgi:hypothetical protein
MNKKEIKKILEDSQKESDEGMKRLKKFSSPLFHRLPPTSMYAPVIGNIYIKAFLKSELTTSCMKGD